MNQQTSNFEAGGIKALFLVWGFPKGTHRSDFLADELGMKVQYIYVTARQGLVTALLKYPIQAVKTFGLLWRLRPQVIFVQEPPIFAVLIVYVWSLLSKARFIIDAHTDALLAEFWEWSLPLHKFLSKRAVTTVVTNTYLNEMVADWGAPAFLLTDSPVPDVPKSSVALAPGFKALYISTASYDEPIKEVLAAATALPNVNFYVTGNYQRDKPSAIELATKNVHFTGYMPDSEFYGMITAADCVICLTTENHTMQSGAGEALWLGKPLVTSDWPMLKGYFSRGTIHVDNSAAAIRQAVETMQANLPYYQAEILALQTERHREWQQKAAELFTLVQKSL